MKTSYRSVILIAVFGLLVAVCGAGVTYHLPTLTPTNIFTKNNWTGASSVLSVNINHLDPFVGGGYDVSVTDEYDNYQFTAYGCLINAAGNILTCSNDGGYATSTLVYNSSTKPPSVLLTDNTYSVPTYHYYAKSN